MSKWIRNYKPTEIDADEWGNILVLRENGQKAVYHWQDYNEHYEIDGETAWMTLPQSDIPQSISITIERGNHSWTIENNGFTIEIHDSRDPMGQPTIFAVTADTNMNALFADAVLSVLESEDEDWCECDEPIRFTVDDVKEFIDEIRASVPASKPKPWQKNRGK